MKYATFAVCGLVVAATAQVVFRRTYGGVDWDIGFSVQQTADGGYIITGYTGSYPAGDFDVWLIKTDALGDTMWTRTHGGPDRDYGRSVAQTANGGYIITGYTSSYGAGDFDVWLIRTDGGGDTVWTRIYGGASVDQGRSVAQTVDSGYIIVGSTQSYGAGGYDVWLIRTDALGDTMWTRTYGGALLDEGRSVKQTLDGGFIVTGFTESYGAGDYDAWLIRTDTSGDTLWTRTYGDTLRETGFSVQQTPDGGYVVVGATQSYGAGERDVWLVRTDALGDTMWTRTYGREDIDYGYSVAQTMDGGYIIGGFTTLPASSEDVWLLKTDSMGDTAWTRAFGGGQFDLGNSVGQTADGGYIIAGHTWSFGAGLTDAWLIKTDSAGLLAVEEPRMPRTRRAEAATIVSAVLRLQPKANSAQSAAVLLDLAGRRVMDLKAGENDVSRLPPGVYFLREDSARGLAGSASRGQGAEGSARGLAGCASSVRKVVIQK